MSIFESLFELTICNDVHLALSTSASRDYTRSAMLSLDDAFISLGAIGYAYNDGFFGRNYTSSQLQNVEFKAQCNILTQAYHSPASSKSLKST